MTDSAKSVSKGGFLGFIERVGNKIPHPIFIFLFLIAVTLVVSACMSGMTVRHPGTGKDVAIVNMLSAEGLKWFLANISKNLTRFTPLGAVLTCMIGIGVCDESGLMKTGVTRAIGGASPTLVTAIVMLVGICGNLASSPIFVIIPPLGAVVFRALGRHPLAGAACGFAGVAAGLSANLLVTPTDVMLLGITERSAQIIDPSVKLNVAGNWYFMFASTIVLTAAGVIACRKFVEPRLGKWTPDMASDEAAHESTTVEVGENEKRGLRYAGWACLVYIALILLTIIPANGILRDPVKHTIVPSPFLSGILAILTVWFLVEGVAYGIGARTIRKSSDVAKMMSRSMSSMGSFIVLCFFAAQFCYLFDYSKIGLWIAVKGSDWIASSGMSGISLLILFILFCSCVNFLIGSASAKWTILSPICVPMFMRIGWSPYYTTALYRIADSVTNSISPLEPFMPYMITLFQRYDRRAGYGTLVSVMLPFAALFMLFWVLLAIVWTWLKLPLGPGAAVFM
ncbi:MAG: AbgT family transporter [Pyramidobacter sp.]